MPPFAVFTPAERFEKFCFGTSPASAPTFTIALEEIRKLTTALADGGLIVSPYNGGRYLLAFNRHNPEKTGICLHGKEYSMSSRQCKNASLPRRVPTVAVIEELEQRRLLTTCTVSGIWNLEVYGDDNYVANNISIKQIIEIIFFKIH